MFIFQFNVWLNYKLAILALEKSWHWENQCGLRESMGLNFVYTPSYICCRNKSTLQVEKPKIRLYKILAFYLRKHKILFCQCWLCTFSYALKTPVLCARWHGGLTISLAALTVWMQDSHAAIPTYSRKSLHV